MAILIKHDARKIEKVTVKELSYSVRFTPTGNNKLVDRFEIINDNFPQLRSAYQSALPRGNGCDL